MAIQVGSRVRLLRNLETSPAAAQKVGYELFVASGVEGVVLEELGECARYIFPERMWWVDFPEPEGFGARGRHLASESELEEFFEDCTCCGQSVGRPTMVGYAGKMMCIPCIAAADEIRWQEEQGV